MAYYSLAYDVSPQTPGPPYYHLGLGGERGEIRGGGGGGWTVVVVVMVVMMIIMVVDMMVVVYTYWL